jgi:TolA-binding protein
LGIDPLRGGHRDCRRVNPDWHRDVPAPEFLTAGPRAGARTEADHHDCAGRNAAGGYGRTAGGSSGGTAQRCCAGAKEAGRRPGSASTAPVAVAAAGGAEQELRIARTLIETGLQEQAATKLRELVTAHPGTQQALDGYFLMAEIEEKRNRPNDAMATYLEIAERFKANPRAAEALYRMARLTLKSQRDGKEAEAGKHSRWSRTTTGKPSGLRSR